LIDLDAGLGEIARVLRPGSRVVALDMALPQNPGLRWVYQFYFMRVLPWIGRVISKHTTAYQWLPESTRVFPQPVELVRRIQHQGFEAVDFELLMGGVCAMYVGTRAAYGD
jgi:demethylmenaquinone methyltransferase/2-methoxy-6-polyprenyl-1,4-benzoquinol methylase